VGKINWNKPESVYEELKTARENDWIGQQLAKNEANKVKKLLDQIDLTKCDKQDVEFLESLHVNFNYKYHKLSEKQLKWLQTLVKLAKK